MQDGTRVQIVGVVEDGKFLSFLKTPTSLSHLVVRSTRDPQQLGADIRRQRHSLDLVFPSMRLKGRKPPRANMLVADHLQPAARKAGITEPVGFHTLRRTFASALLANGCDLRLVQELLRHSNPGITLDA